MDQQVRTEIATELLGAYQSREPVEPLTGRYPQLDLDDAYEIQLLQVGRWRADGARVKGHKVGLTSAAMQRQMNVSFARVSTTSACAIKASTTGSAMPARLFDPLSAAACDEKYERSESPGVAEKLSRSTVISKSKSSRRARYCGIEKGSALGEKGS